MYAQKTQAQTKAAVVQIYPESDGKPMAETDVHRSLLTDLVFTLETHFQSEPDVYVSGNLLVYYVKNNPAKCIAPDVFFVRGVPKGQRRIYKLWEEGVAPQIVIELTSRKTWKEDLQTKWRLYEELGVQEYFIFDPEYDYLDEPLVGYRLEAGKYVEIEVKDRRVESEVLELELVDTGETLRLFDTNSNQFLPTPQEAQDRVSELEATLERYRKQFGELPK
ncbi:MAG: Uma2 family endonuclease [Acidobacteria bacterium]|nr:Uma2 family endonuclease [Acidobacteriota bacterium]